MRVLNSNGMKKFTLTKIDAANILRQSRLTSPVALIALDYNWGPPVSGRFDEDFFQIWAAARLDVHPQKVKLLSNVEQYWSPQKWNDALAFEPLDQYDAYRLYLLSAKAYFSEFVIKLETEDGQIYYDNNGGHSHNFRIAPHSGRGTTAIAGDGAIFKLPGIVPVTLLSRDSS